jgi:hypothetical protein
MDRDADAVHGAFADRSHKARVVRHPEGDPTFRANCERGAHRREGLRDRGVDTAVDDAHRLTNLRTNGQVAGAPADLVGLVDDEADGRVERVLNRYAELIRCGVGHERRS